MAKKTRIFLELNEYGVLSFQDLETLSDSLIDDGSYYHEVDSEVDYVEISVALEDDGDEWFESDDIVFELDTPLGVKKLVKKVEELEYVFVEEDTEEEIEEVSGEYVGAYFTLETKDFDKGGTYFIKVGDSANALKLRVSSFVDINENTKPYYVAKERININDLVFAFVYGDIKRVLVQDDGKWVVVDNDGKELTLYTEEVVEAVKTLVDIEFDKDTNKLTFTFSDESTKVVDLSLEVVEG